METPTRSMRSFAILLFAVAAVVGASLVLSGIVTAQTTPDADAPEQNQQEQQLQPNQEPVEGAPAEDPATIAETAPAPMVAEIESTGDILLRGTVTAVNQDSLTVENWGNEWTVRMMPEGAVIPNGPSGLTDLSLISVGDFVGLEGTIATDEQYTVDASFMRDWTTDPFPGAFPDRENGAAMTEPTPTEEGTAAPATLDTEATPEPGTSPETTESPDADTEESVPADSGAATTISSWSGTVDSVSDNSFEFTDETGTTYTVEVVDASIVDENGNEIALDDLSAGDDVTVNGTLDGTTITPTSIEADTGFLFF